MTALSTALAEVNLKGNVGDLPDPGVEGRLYFAVDAEELYRDDGTAWEVVALTAGTGGGGGGGSVALDEVSDVNAPTPADGDALVFDAASLEWISAPVGAGSAALNDLADVNAPTPTDGQVLLWDSTPGEWVAGTVAGPGSITVSEPDGTPAPTAISALVFPNGSVSIVGTTATVDPAASSSNYTGSPWSSGTSFPASPVANQRFTRTDLGLDFFWNLAVPGVSGSGGWTTTELYEMPFGPVNNVAASNTYASRIACPSQRGGSDIFLVGFQMSGFHVAGGSALSNSHRWMVRLHALSSGTGATGYGFADHDIKTGSRNVWQVGSQKSVGLKLHQTLPSAARVSKTLLALGLYKTGTPGNLYCYCSVTYRICAV